MGRNPFLQPDGKSETLLFTFVGKHLGGILPGYFKLCFDKAERSGLGCSVAKGFHGVAVALGKFTAQVSVLGIILVWCGSLSCPVLAGGAWSQVALGLSSSQK